MSDTYPAYKFETEIFRKFAHLAIDAVCKEFACDPENVCLSMEAFHESLSGNQIFWANFSVRDLDHEFVDGGAISLLGEKPQFFKFK